MAALDDADTGDRAEARRFAVVLVVGEQQPDFEEARAGIDQPGDAFARGHLAGAVLAVDFGGSAARPQPLFERFHLVDHVAHVRHACDLGCGRWRGRGFGNCAHVM